MEMAVFTLRNKPFPRRSPPRARRAVFIRLYSSEKVGTKRKAMETMTARSWVGTRIIFRGLRSFSKAATSAEGGQRKLPNVLVDTIGRVHVAWYDAADHPGALNTGKREIYYTRLVYKAGYVAGGSVSKRRLTTTTNGYSPNYNEAPEMAEDRIDGALHIAWPDDESATSSKGIRYLKLTAGGSVAVASKLLFDGSGASASPRNGNNQAIAPLAEPAENGTLVKSPIVGTFFRSADPSAPPFVGVGDRVKV
jgi:biotin carboxyl carrier protein